MALTPHAPVTLPPHVEGEAPEASVCFSENLSGTAREVRAVTLEWGEPTFPSPRVVPGLVAIPCDAANYGVARPEVDHWGLLCPKSQTTQNKNP